MTDKEKADSHVPHALPTKQKEAMLNHIQIKKPQKGGPVRQRWLWEGPNVHNPNPVCREGVSVFRTRDTQKSS